MLNDVFDKVPEIYSFSNLAYRGTSFYTKVWKTADIINRRSAAR